MAASRAPSAAGTAAASGGHVAPRRLGQRRQGYRSLVVEIDIGHACSTARTKTQRSRFSASASFLQREEVRLRRALLHACYSGLPLLQRTAWCRSARRARAGSGQRSAGSRKARGQRSAHCRGSSHQATPQRMGAHSAGSTTAHTLWVDTVSAHPTRESATFLSTAGCRESEMSALRVADTCTERWRQYMTPTDRR